MPEVAGAVLSRLGSAALAPVCVDRSPAYQDSISLFSGSQTVGITDAVFADQEGVRDLAQAQLQIVVLFYALPPASSTYILATRMGGNGPLVAFLIFAGKFHQRVLIQPVTHLEIAQRGRLAQIYSTDKKARNRRRAIHPVADQLPQLKRNAAF